MSYSFTDLGAEGCCRSLNALLLLRFVREIRILSGRCQGILKKPVAMYPEPCHCGHNIFKCIFLNENVKIALKISLKFVPKGPINYIPSLVQIMACRR